MFRSEGEAEVRGAVANVERCVRRHVEALPALTADEGADARAPERAAEQSMPMISSLRS